MTAKLSMKEAAIQVLRESDEPLHYTEITRRALEQELFETEGRTPQDSLNARIAVDIKRHGEESVFLRVRPGYYSLRESTPLPHSSLPPEEQSRPEESDDERRVKIPLYPSHATLRSLLPLWDGVTREQILGLRRTIVSLRGTPQAPVEWTDPDAWIEERLSGEDQVLAARIWKKSKKTVNPRYLYGSWLLCLEYALLREDPQGVMCLTEQGQDFVTNPNGPAETRVDEGEGNFKVLALVADSGPTRLSGLTDAWGEYLRRRSNYSSESTIKSTLRLRLKALSQRGLVDRAGVLYSITDAGLERLERRPKSIEPDDTREDQKLRELVRAREVSVRTTLQELLRKMDPFAFEHLVKRLLEHMGYDNVEVTSPSNDGGVDVIGEIELGITSVREVIQAKRYKRTIQRKVLDALRGSLHRFRAVRGTIITTSRFSKGTISAAFEAGAAPITLIDGERLIDLLIENELGVRKRSVEVLELEPEVFSEIEDEV